MRCKFRPWRLVACLLLSTLALSSLFFPQISFTLAKFLKNIVHFIPPQGGSVLCEGRIVDIWKRREGRENLLVQDLRCLEGEKMVPLSGRIRLSRERPVWIFRDKLAPGDIIRFQTSLRRPKDFQNFGGAYFERYCLAKNISAVGFLPGRHSIVKIGEEKSFLGKAIDAWRDSVEGVMARSISESSAQKLVTALILSDLSGFEDEELEDFRELGLIHILVVSGLHIAVLGGIVWWLVIALFTPLSLFFGQRDLRTTASFLSIAVLWAFVALTGFGLPAVRAGIVATLYLLSIIFRKSYDIWDALAVSAVLILVVNPYSLYDLSFQLTYAAVIGILWSLRYRLPLASAKGLLLKSSILLLNALIISLGASIGIWPLLIFHFGRLATLGPLLNIFLSPIVTAVIVPPALMASFLAPFFPHCAGLVFRAVAGPSSFFMELAHLLADSLSWSEVRIPFQDSAIFALYVLAAAAQVPKFRKALLISSALVLCFGFFMRGPLKFTKGELAVTFLDVGQGSAVFVRLPDGKTVFIDGGGIKGSDFDIGKSVLAPFLERAGIVTVDTLIVTHPHSDHFKGLGFIAENFHPKELLLGSYREEQLDPVSLTEWHDFLERVRKAGVEVRTLQQSEWKEGRVAFSLFSPPLDIPFHWNVNDASTVIRIQFGEISFLITGDIERSAEDYLLKEGVDPASTVMQVPHHGSSTSSSAGFLEKVSPQYAVIQVGAFNKYGFPEAEVLRRYEEQGIQLYRNDRHGAVIFKTDGKRLTATTALD